MRVVLVGAVLLAMVSGAAGSQLPAGSTTTKEFQTKLLVSQAERARAAGAAGQCWIEDFIPAVPNGPFTKLDSDLFIRTRMSLHSAGCQYRNPQASVPHIKFGIAGWKT